MQTVQILKSPAAINRLLSKVGVANETTKKLYTTAVLVKDHYNNWAIAHFKQLLAILSDTTSEEHIMLDEDHARLENILSMLVRFGMITVSPEPKFNPEYRLKVLKDEELVEHGGQWEVHKKFTPSAPKMDRIHKKLRNEM